MSDIDREMDVLESIFCGDFVRLEPVRGPARVPVSTLQSECVWAQERVWGQSHPVFRISITPVTGANDIRVTLTVKVTRDKYPKTPYVRVARTDWPVWNRRPLWRSRAPAPPCAGPR